MLEAVMLPALIIPCFVFRLGIFSVLFVSAVLVTLLGKVECFSSTERKTRSVGLTNGGRINIGVQFVLPMTLTVPPVTGSGRRGKRSLYDPFAASIEYETDADHGPQLRKLDNYFLQLSIDEEACRLRLLCEMAANPDPFYPLSDLMLSKISDIGQTDASSKGSTSRMQNYEHAVYLGIAGNGTCGTYFGEDCSDGPTDLVNLPLLAAWQLVSDFFDIGVYTELDT